MVLEADSKTYLRRLRAHDTGISSSGARTVDEASLLSFISCLPIERPRQFEQSVAYCPCQGKHIESYDTRTNEYRVQRISKDFFGDPNSVWTVFISVQGFLLYSLENARWISKPGQHADNDTKTKCHILSARARETRRKAFSSMYWFKFHSK